MGDLKLTDPENSWWERLKGLGSILLGVIGLKYLLNPFSLITDILGIVDAITGLGGDKGGSNKGNNRRRGRGNARRRRNRQRGRGVRRAPSIDPIADSSAGRRLSPFQLEQARKTASAVDAPGANLIYSKDYGMALPMQLKALCREAGKFRCYW